MLGDVGSDHGFDEEDTARQTQDEMGKLIPSQAHRPDGDGEDGAEEQKF